jgi:hypothetical protein
MMGITLSSWLIRNGVHWRVTACLAAWMTAIASSIVYLFVQDSAHARDEPQNPIDPALFVTWFPDQMFRRKRWTINKILRVVGFVLHTNILPSVRHIVGSGTFWLVALSHTGASMVRTSERLLGSYFWITSDGTLSYDRAASLAVWHSVGTIVGLFVAGKIFASKPDRDRKWMVSRLYLVAILACYVLSITAIPAVRNFVQAPDAIRILQVMAVASAGFGIAVQFYHIPSLVGASFGCDKGLFLAYTDGVAYGLVALVWRYIGHSMRTHDRNDATTTTLEEYRYAADHHSYASGGSGWAYGWAAVALLLLVSAILMVEFMEHYFCRPQHGVGRYETIIFA